MTYMLIAVMCIRSWSLSCTGYELRTFDTFSTMSECQEVAQSLKGSGIAIRYYCKGDVK